MRSFVFPAIPNNAKILEWLFVAGRTKTKNGRQKRIHRPIWDEITRQLNVDKIYLETHRDLLIVEQKTLDFAKKIFQGQRS